MCRTLNPLDQLNQKWIFRIVLKTSFVYCLLNSDNSYNFKHLNDGGSIQNDNTDSMCDFFTGGTDTLKPVSSFTTKLWSTSGIPPTPTPKKKKL